MAQRWPMTKQGHERLKAELADLVSKQRPQVIEAIAEARAHGDLKENAEYHAAREQQGFIEARIKELEGKLAQAQVIDVTQIANTGKVIFGTTVDLLNVDTEEEVRYTLVCEDEADLKQNKISVQSPIARSMIGKEVGDVVFVRTPSGSAEYEIVDVLHIWLPAPYVRIVVASPATCCGKKLSS